MTSWTSTAALEPTTSSSGTHTAPCLLVVVVMWCGHKSESAHPQTFRLTGRNTAANLGQTIVIDDPSATILFSSDVDITYSGFRLTYQGGTASPSSFQVSFSLFAHLLFSSSPHPVDCNRLDRCNGNGVCTANGSAFYCACYEGWNGSTCALPLPHQPAPSTWLR